MAWRGVAGGWGGAAAMRGKSLGLDLVRRVHRPAAPDMTGQALDSARVFKVGDLGLQQPDAPFLLIDPRLNVWVALLSAPARVVKT